MAKVARSVSADDFPLPYIPFSSRLLEKRTHELLLSQPNSYQWQEVEAHLIEMFTERSAECEDITRFTGFFVEDLILNIERLSNNEKRRHDVIVLDQRNWADYGPVEISSKK